MVCRKGRIPRDGRSAGARHGVFFKVMRTFCLVISSLFSFSLFEFRNTALCFIVAHFRCFQFDSFSMSVRQWINHSHGQPLDQQKYVHTERGSGVLGQSVNFHNMFHKERRFLIHPPKTFYNQPVMKLYPHFSIAGSPHQHIVAFYFILRLMLCNSLS